MRRVLRWLWKKKKILTCWEKWFYGYMDYSNPFWDFSCQFSLLTLLLLVVNMFPWMVLWLLLGKRQKFWRPLFGFGMCFQIWMIWSLVKRNFFFFCKICDFELMFKIYEKKKKNVLKPKASTVNFDWLIFIHWIIVGFWKSQIMFFLINSFFFFKQSVLSIFLLWFIWNVTDFQFNHDLIDWMNERICYENLILFCDY